MMRVLVFCFLFCSQSLFGQLPFGTQLQQEMDQYKVLELDGKWGLYHYNTTKWIIKPQYLFLALIPYDNFHLVIAVDKKQASIHDFDGNLIRSIPFSSYFAIDNYQEDYSFYQADKTRWASRIHPQDNSFYFGDSLMGERPPFNRFDGAGKLFSIERKGDVLIINNQQEVQDPFMILSSRVNGDNVDSLDANGDPVWSPRFFPGLSGVWNIKQKRWIIRPENWMSAEMGGDYVAVRQQGNDFKEYYFSSDGICYDSLIRELNWKSSKAFMDRQRTIGREYFPLLMSEQIFGSYLITKSEKGFGLVDPFSLEQILPEEYDHIEQFHTGLILLKDDRIQIYFPKSGVRFSVKGSTVRAYSNYSREDESVFYQLNGTWWRVVDQQENPQLEPVDSITGISILTNDDLRSFSYELKNGYALSYGYYFPPQSNTPFIRIDEQGNVIDSLDANGNAVYPPRDPSSHFASVYDLKSKKMLVRSSDYRRAFLHPDGIALLSIPDSGWSFSFSVLDLKGKIIREKITRDELIQNIDRLRQLPGLSRASTIYDTIFHYTNDWLIYNRAAIQVDGKWGVFNFYSYTWDLAPDKDLLCFQDEYQIYFKNQKPCWQWNMNGMPVMPDIQGDFRISKDFRTNLVSIENNSGNYILDRILFNIEGMHYFFKTPFNTRSLNGISASYDFKYHKNKLFVSYYSEGSQESIPVIDENGDPVILSYDDFGNPIFKFNSLPDVGSSGVYDFTEKKWLILSDAISRVRPVGDFFGVNFVVSRNEEEWRYGLYDSKGILLPGKMASIREMYDAPVLASAVLGFEVKSIQRGIKNVFAWKDEPFFRVPLIVETPNGFGIYEMHDREWLLEPSYDRIEPITMIGNYLLVKDGKLGIGTSTGEILADTKYTIIEYNEATEAFLLDGEKLVSEHWSNALLDKQEVNINAPNESYYPEIKRYFSAHSKGSSILINERRQSPPTVYRYDDMGEPIETDVRYNEEYNYSLTRVLLENGVSQSLTPYQSVVPLQDGYFLAESNLGHQFILNPDYSLHTASERSDFMFPTKDGVMIRSNENPYYADESGNEIPAAEVRDEFYPFRVYPSYTILSHGKEVKSPDSVRIWSYIGHNVYSGVSRQVTFDPDVLDGVTMTVFQHYLLFLNSKEHSFSVIPVDKHQGEFYSLNNDTVMLAYTGTGQQDELHYYSFSGNTLKEYRTIMEPSISLMGDPAKSRHYFVATEKTTGVMDFTGKKVYQFNNSLVTFSDTQIPFLTDSLKGIAIRNNGAVLTDYAFYLDLHYMETASRRIYYRLDAGQLKFADYSGKILFQIPYSGKLPLTVIENDRPLEKVSFLNDLSNGSWYEVNFAKADSVYCIGNSALLSSTQFQLLNRSDLNVQLRKVHFANGTHAFLAADDQIIFKQDEAFEMEVLDSEKAMLTGVLALKDASKPKQLIDLQNMKVIQPKWYDESLVTKSGLDKNGKPYYEILCRLKVNEWQHYRFNADFSVKEVLSSKFKAEFDWVENSPNFILRKDASGESVLEVDERGRLKTKYTNGKLLRCGEYSVFQTATESILILEDLHLPKTEMDFLVYGLLKGNDYWLYAQGGKFGFLYSLDDPENVEKRKWVKILPNFDTLFVSELFPGFLQSHNSIVCPTTGKTYFGNGYSFVKFQSEHAYAKDQKGQLYQLLLTGLCDSDRQPERVDYFITNYSPNWPCIAEMNGKFGVLDYSGKRWISDPRYDAIEKVFLGDEVFFIVTAREKMTILKRDGNPLNGVWYDFINPLGFGAFVVGFYDVKTESNHAGIISITSETMIPVQKMAYFDFKELTDRSLVFLFSDGKEMSLFRQNGSLVFKEKFVDLTVYPDGSVILRRKAPGAPEKYYYGLGNCNGDIIYTCQFDNYDFEVTRDENEDEKYSFLFMSGKQQKIASRDAKGRWSLSAVSK